ncbi:hypothetical protein V6N13_100440 [Hibiscus sabdariffa]
MVTTERKESWKRGGCRQRQVFTLFIENLSEKLHWQGLWFAFGRHGEVVDAFIARKRNCRGQRFGFVRYGKRIDAERAIRSLNGFVLFGSKIKVSMARYKPRQAFWRRVCQVNPENSKGSCIFSGNGGVGGPSEEPKQNENKNPEEDGKEKGECSTKNTGNCKRVVGMVEIEALWKFKRCLVGTMPTVCSVRSVMERLHKWGLSEITIKRMGGKKYLLSFEDDELYMMLEEVHWSYLKEIFLRSYHGLRMQVMEKEPPGLNCLGCHYIAGIMKP